MENDNTANILELLIKFGSLPKREQTKFLSSMNDYLYASPQRRKQMLGEWETHHLLAGMN